MSLTTSPYAKPDEIAYLEARGYRDTWGGWRLFEKPLSGHDVDRRNPFKNVVLSRYVDEQYCWQACASEVAHSMGQPFPDPIAAFVDAEIRNWGRV
jgi:hypothetical protein